MVGRQGTGRLMVLDNGNQMRELLTPPSRRITLMGPTLAWLRHHMRP